jgi:hypothetical protein
MIFLIALFISVSFSGGEVSEDVSLDGENEPIYYIDVESSEITR